MGRRKKRAIRTGAPRLALVSLGCSKNLVDSEVILGRAGTAGFALVFDPADADVVIVNTCGFIDDARRESIEAIRGACRLKGRPGGRRHVVVTGCLAHRSEDLRREVPGIDGFVGFTEYEGIGEILHGLLARPDGEARLHVGVPDGPCQLDVGRLRLTPRPYAYLRISEGCDNPCTFCTIPSIRGPFRSKPIEAVCEEAEELVGSGAREINLISQDSTSYGRDLYGRLSLPELMASLGRIDGLEWIRLLYAHPATFTSDLMDAMAGLDKVVKYVDIPIQHVADEILRRMGRGMSGAGTRELLAEIRHRIPGVVLRTTVIVGFPGETDAEYRVLRDFVEEFRFERLGVFVYSPEEGTPAFRLPGRPDRDEAGARRDDLMRLQQRIAFAHGRSRVGELARVLVEEEVPGRPGSFWGRSSAEAPEVDPRIILAGARTGAGCFEAVRITGTDGYDLVGAVSPEDSFDDGSRGV